MKYRVWNMVNFKNELDYYAVNSAEEGIRLIDGLSYIQLKNEAITDNAFGLEVYNEESGEWEEWEDEEGNNVDDYELVNGIVVLKEYV